MGEIVKWQYKKKGDETMETSTNRLSKFALWMLAIVPGFYALNFISNLFFHLPPVWFYIIILASAILYLALIIIIHKAYIKLKEYNLNPHKEKVIHHLDM